MSLDLRFDIEQNSAALFAGLMAAARDGVLLLDAVGQIICLNAAGAKLGRENETPLEIGRNWLALWSADQQDLLQTALDQVFEGGQSQVTLPDPAQSQASLDLSLSPIRDDRGEVVYALATICLSEQGELSHLRQELATLRGELDQLRQAQQAAQDLETDRLEALSATHLMDSPQEARFDELTQLAATALNVKTALISLVEKDRQWFKSRVNFDTTETPRKVSFCSIAIETPDQVMVVEDARTDPRVCANPLVHSGPQIGFYAGAPLVTSEGYALGTLCVIDTEPRQFSERERQVLKTIAATVMTEIELAIQKRERDALDVINMELRHRMGNTYAQVASLVTFLGRADEDKASFIAKLRENISALARLQTDIALNNWSEIPASALLHKALGAQDGEAGDARLMISVTEERLVDRQAAFMLTLALQELMSNSKKYGALAGPGGQVAIGFAVSGGKPVITWEDRRGAAPLDGPIIAKGTGFGTKLLTQIVPTALEGLAEIYQTPAGGFGYRLEFAADRVQLPQA